MKLDDVKTILCWVIVILIILVLSACLVPTILNIMGIR